MPANPRKRQKRKERHAAQRKTKQQQHNREKNAGLAERLEAAANCPILHSCATTDLWDEGLGWVCLSRELPNGSVAFGVFLVDRYCLGVKNVMVGITSRYNYEQKIVTKMRSNFRAKDLPPAATRKIVEGAVAYAGALGLPPHPDYHQAQLIFGAIDASESKETLEFGQDGQPFFYAGPHDSPERCRLILKTLEQSCGSEGFHYLIPFAGSNQILPAGLQGRPARVIGQDQDGTIREYKIDLS